MDSAIQSGRKYPGYTTAELEQFVAQGQGNPVMLQEITDRKAGRSLTLHERLAAASTRKTSTTTTPQA